MQTCCTTYWFGPPRLVTAASTCVLVDCCAPLVVVVAIVAVGVVVAAVVIGIVSLTLTVSELPLPLLETNAAAATPAPMTTRMMISRVVRVTAQMLKRHAESAVRSPAIALSATLPKPSPSAGSKIFSAPFRVSSAS